MKQFVFFSHPYSMLQTNVGEYYENSLQFFRIDQKIDKDLSDAWVEEILDGITYTGNAVAVDDETANRIIELIQDSDSKVNPVAMATKFYGEQGPIGELYRGKPIYNIFNFSAENGREDSREYAYNQGWFSLEACMEGSEKEFDKFIERGQNTLYSLDWDYITFKEAQNMGSEEYVMQYATLVNSGEDNAITLGQMRGGIIDLNQSFVFSIPIYENIPTYNNEEYAPYPDPNHANKE